MRAKIFLLISLFPFICGAQVITTVAGNGTGGFSGDGGAATAAKLGVLPGTYGVAADNAGNFYIVDRGNNRIRKVNSAGIITTFAGSGATTPVLEGIPATASAVEYPEGIATDNAGNVYFGDVGSGSLGHCKVRKVNSAGIITTYAGNGTNGSAGDGGPATAAQLSQPAYMATDRIGNLYICDINMLRTRKVDTNGIITTFAGTGIIGFSGDGGPATAAQFVHNFGVACDTFGNVYINDFHRIRKVDPAGIITTIAGTGAAGYSGDGGPATAANIDAAYGLAIDKYGNLYFGDHNNKRVRKIDASGIITTVAGTGTSGFSGDGGPATAAMVTNVVSVCLDTSGILYIDDYSNNRIRSFQAVHSVPHFSFGEAASFVACSGGADSLNTRLAVAYSDPGVGLTWSILMPAAHGTAVASYSVTSTGGTETPSGTYYTPASGYTGTDSFSVVVSDGATHDTIMLHYTVSDCALSVGGTRGTEKPTLFPNPTTGEFTVDLKNASFTSFSIINPIGTVIATEKIAQPVITVNVRSLPPGVYYLVLNGADGHVTNRFIKQ